MIRGVLLMVFVLGLLAGCGANPARVPPGSASSASSTERVSGQPSPARATTTSSEVTVATTSTSGPERPTPPPSTSSEASAAVRHTVTVAGTVLPRPLGVFTPTPPGGVVLVRPRQLTAEDGGATVRLQVGDTFSVVLPAPTFGSQAADRLHPPRWTVGISNPAVLVRVGDDGPGTYRAAAAGTATLSIAGQPSGLPSDEPPLPVGVELVVHVVVG